MLGRQPGATRTATPCPSTTLVRPGGNAEASGVCAATVRAGGRFTDDRDVSAAAGPTGENAVAARPGGGADRNRPGTDPRPVLLRPHRHHVHALPHRRKPGRAAGVFAAHLRYRHRPAVRSEEHTSELQSLMRTSYDAFCLKKKKHTYKARNHQ